MTHTRAKSDELVSLNLYYQVQMSHCAHNQENNNNKVYDVSLQKRD
jgi:hypothetical protein